MSPIQHGFSLTSLPIGLGLTTAAHVHLFNRSLAKTQEQRQHYQVHQQLREIEMIVQSLQDMANLTEIVELLNITLEKFPDYHSGKARRRQKFKRVDPHFTTRKSTVKERRRSVDVTNTDVSLKGKEKATTQGPNNIEHVNGETIKETTSIVEPFEVIETKETVEAAEAIGESSEPAIGKPKSRTRGEGSTRSRRSKKYEPVIITTGSSGNICTQPAVAYMYLPLVPTLFVSGLHFVAYARTQFALNKIRKDTKEQVRFARRLSLLSAFLLVREKRLNWMVEEIKSYEKEHSTSEDGEYSSRNGVPRPLVLVQNSHQRVVNLLTGERNDRQRREHHRRLPSIDPSMFSFGPDLENMDLDKFLQDPFERAKILRLELEAMREELVVFGKVIAK
ncbi:hypothetical protein BGZ52_001790 [Haplosporangium bisporale]|nr:hypothetical protein BGZ52_001790 [Haplosporangium bisporale]